jgi:AraC family transcriptional regulator, ethanolamine operon transcriptional activator
MAAILANPRDSRHVVLSRQFEGASDYGRQCADWDSSFQQIRRGTFKAQLTEAWLGPVQVRHQTFGQSFHWRGAPWRGSRVFASYLPNEGGDLYCNNRPLPANSFVGYGWDQLDRVTCHGGAQLFLVAVDDDLLSSYIMRTYAAELSVRSAQAVIFSPDPALAHSFQQEILSVLRDLTGAPEVLSDFARRRIYQERVLGCIVNALYHFGTSGRSVPPPPTRAYVVDLAVRFMDAHIADRITLDDVCGAVRVSPRTLRYSFEAIMGISPTEYLLACRLNLARDALANPKSQMPIQMAAARSGFWHMGRFAKSYRQMFGERPSETCLRLRGRAATVSSLAANPVSC